MTSWISIIKFNFLDSGFLGTTNSSTHHLVEKELLYLCALSLSHSSSHCPLYRPLLCECYKFECCYYSSSFAQIQICTNTNTEKIASWLKMSTLFFIDGMSPKEDPVSICIYVFCILYLWIHTIISPWFDPCDLLCVWPPPCSSRWWWRTTVSLPEQINICKKTKTRQKCKKSYAQKEGAD